MNTDLDVEGPMFKISSRIKVKQHPWRTSKRASYINLPFVPSEEPRKQDKLKD
jgi:hypothetical protein